jgi:single-stranded DNA-binding protein
MGSKADYVARFHNGQRVLVIGRLEIGEWATREGEPRTSYDIWADDVVNLSPRDEGLNGSEGQSERPARPAADRQPVSNWRDTKRSWRRARPRRAAVLSGFCKALAVTDGR